MGFEIDFLDVGEGEKSGDAVVIRFGNLFGSRTEQVVMVVDAGYQADGDRVAEHIQRFYGTPEVDLVVSTHPDNDHIGGLPTVLSKLAVRELWMHRPWRFSREVADYYQRGRIGEATYRTHLRASLETAVELERIAMSMGIPINDPLAGLTAFGDRVVVLGPSLDYYCSLVPDFRGAPEGAAAPATAPGRLIEALLSAGHHTVESWGVEMLTDKCQTSPENNSSAILLLRLENQMCMLTADAGAPALDRAVDVLDQLRTMDRSQPRFLQVPHHGSERNVGSAVLNKWIGQPRAQQVTERYAIVSAAKDGAPKHPAKRVINAFIRRGVQVAAPQGKALCYSSNAPQRAGYAPVTPLPFDPNVDDD